jgi:hypothetical protein
MIGLDHVVLFFTEKTVLWGKQAGELAWKGCHDQIAAMAKMAVCGCLVAEQGEAFACEGDRGLCDEVFYADGYHKKGLVEFSSD